MHGPAAIAFVGCLFVSRYNGRIRGEAGGARADSASAPTSVLPVR